MKIRRIAPALLAIAISGYGLYNIAGNDVKAIIDDYKEKFSVESDVDTVVDNLNTSSSLSAQAYDEEPFVPRDEEEVVVEEEPVVIYPEYKDTYLLDHGYEFKSLDFIKYNDENSDIIGYITIPGTEIDYKVYQSEPGTDPAEDPYLHADAEGNVSVMGSNGRWQKLYSEISVNSNVDLSLGDDSSTVQTSTIDFFGHNQRNGKMFTDLMKFKNQSFLDNHPYGVYYTEDGSVYALEIVGGYLTSGDSLEHIHVDNLNDQATFDAFNQYLEENAKVRSDVNLELGDKIVVLSTCSYEHENYRYVVVCKAVKQYRTIEEYEADQTLNEENKTLIR